MKYKKLYLPALSIVAGVLLLLILISMSTYHNLDREKRNMLTFLRREGLSLIYALKAGIETVDVTQNGDKVIDTLFQKTAESEDVAYIYLMDSLGTVIHHSDPGLISADTPNHVWANARNREVTVIRELPGGIRMFELCTPFLGQTHIVLGLTMAAFDDARRADLHHAVIMAAIVVALGSGALFFIFVIQNYYLVDKTLKRTQDYTQQVVANMANGLLSINLSGEVVSYNRLVLELLALKEDTVLGLDLKTVMDFDATGISETLSHHRPVLDREIAYTPRSGEILPLSMSVTPILNDAGQCSGAVILLQDLREIKRLQEKVRRSEKLAAIGKLAASVAHEIRNPLSSIKGFAKFLSHTLKDRPEEKEYADVMVREVDRINRVVTDLLTYARPLTFKRKKINLKELTDHTVRLVAADARSRNIDLIQRLPGDLPDLWMDENQLTQALLNLLLNALFAVTENGHVETGAEIDSKAGLLSLWVEDDGKGIPPEYQDKILDPFFTTRDTGTGLGLAIVHKIVENHQGEIKIESPPRGKKQGTRISLLLPLISQGIEQETE